MLHVHGGLDGDAAVGLTDALLHGQGHLGGGIADVDLADGNVVLAPIQAQRLGQIQLGARMAASARSRATR